PESPPPESPPPESPPPESPPPQASPRASAANAPGTDFRPAARVRRRADARVRELCDPPTYMDASGIRHFKKGCV
ncbi:MAG TPA: hypothetical protein VNN80_10930, partial [Polyangiaceae bacterium]|nr:hypothetical protein [Polyangiaceae bacterium]